MDQKTLNSLDPKLKATYDRIMAVPTTSQPQMEVGTYTPQPVSAAPPPSPVPQQPTAQQVSPPLVPVVTPPSPQPSQPPPNPVSQASSHVTGMPLVPQQKSHRGLIISSIVSALLLLGVYVLFWLKFFNIPVGY